VTVHTDSSGPTLYGAIEVKLHIETDKGTTLAPPDVRVLMEDLMIITDSHRNWFWDINNGRDYTVTLISPIGWLAEYEARFKVAFKRATVVGTPTITSVRYFDINGVEVTGPDATQYMIVVDNG